MKNPPGLVSLEKLQGFDLSNPGLHLVMRAPVSTEEHVRFAEFQIKNLSRKAG